MDITKGEVNIKFKELCNDHFRSLRILYFNEDEYDLRKYNNPNISKNELELIENTIKQIIIVCFKNETFEENKISIICDQLKFRFLNRYRQYSTNNSYQFEKDRSDLLESIRMCTHKIIETLYNYIINKIIFDPVLFTDCELFD